MKIWLITSGLENIVLFNILAKYNHHYIIYWDQNNFSYEDYIEAAYAIKQFGRMFNVTTYWHMIQNVKKRNLNL